MSELGLSKLRGVMRRRKVVIVTTTLAALAIGAIIVWQLEPGYKASAVLRVAEVQPAREYVPPTVVEQVGDRLKSLRLSVMARPVVAQAAKELNLYSLYPNLKPDMVVDAIRSRMDVKVEGEDTFLLTYVDSTAERAQAIANRVANIFMQQHLDRRQKIAAATTQAIQGEATTLEPQVAAAEKAVRDFKLKHYGSLPEQQEGNLRTLDQTTMELNIQSTNLDGNLERRRQIVAGTMSSLRHHEEQLAAELYEARTRYTEEHPEVKRINSEYDRIRQQRLDDEKDLFARTRRSNPELMALDRDIDRGRAFVEGLRTRQADVRRRVEATAKNGQELASLVSTYEGLRDKYHSTLGRLRDAELAEGLEKGLSALRFDVIDGASTPQSPASPNRPLLAALVLVLALGLGIGSGFVVDQQDTTIRDLNQLREAAPSTPIFVCIPRFNQSQKADVKAEA